MPEQQNQESKGLTLNKKDPYRGWTQKVDGIAGINTTQPPNAIQDNEVVSIFNYLPIAKNRVKKVHSPAVVCNLPSDAIKFVNDVLSGALVMWVILTDGSMGTITSGTYTQVAAAGTFSGDPALIDITNWRNLVFLIVDKVKGYFLFNGTSASPISAPSVPSLSQLSGGSIIATTYYVKISYVNAWGETVASSETSLAVSSSYLLKVTSPAASTGATGWNVYVGTTTGGEVLQNTNGLIAIGTDWTQPTSGLLLNRYPYLNNTTGGLSLISSSLNGRTITVWASRVFIGNDRNLNYSAPGSYLDFNTVNGGGLMQVSFTDLKQEIIKVSTNMDSFFILGDHGVIAITGTTISNDPATWYQMEIGNTYGTYYGNLAVSFNNIFHLYNEFGIWMLASTQNQKLDYEFDMSEVTVNNYQAAIAQVGNLNFYFLPVRMYSLVSNMFQDMLLLYCIDLKKFYCLDFGFPLKGVYTTLSETDHSVYAWGNSKVYKLFSGTDNVKGVVRLKTFDLGDPYIVKLVSYFLLNAYVVSGDPAFVVTVLASQFNQVGQASNAVTMVNQTKLYELLSSTVYPGIAMALTNSFGQAMTVFSPTATNYFINDIFAAKVGGNMFDILIQDDSNAIYHFVDFVIQGFLGRRSR